jgi:hypothetical protein
VELTVVADPSEEVEVTDVVEVAPRGEDRIRC